MKKFNIGIVGHGFVGQAIEYGFTNDLVNITISDPRLGTTIDDLDEDLDVAFVAVPTPMGDNGKIDASIVISVVGQLVESTEAIIVLKSTVTPDIVEDIAEMAPSRFVYNPEFLTEANAKEDFVDTKFHVFGGTDYAVGKAIECYIKYSNCYDLGNIWSCTAPEAAFVKYTINTFLATKVTFFNQMKDDMDRFGADYDDVMDIVKQDSRIGTSHMQVPGPDGKRGFGGACFPKDTAAMYNFSDDFELLKSVLTINNNYRKVYELDEREKEMNVTFGDA